MKPVRNSKGKLVCQVDDSTRTIEIVSNGVKTTIQLMPDGRFKITNT